MSWEIQYIICRGTFRPAARHAANEAEKFIAILLVYNQFKFWFVFCFYFSLLFILRNCMCVYVDFCFCLKLLRFLLAYSFALSFNLYFVIVYFVCIVNWRQIILICSFVLSAARLICIYFILVVCLLFLWVFFFTFSQFYIQLSFILFVRFEYFTWLLAALAYYCVMVGVGSVYPPMGSIVFHVTNFNQQSEQVFRFDALS